MPDGRIIGHRDYKDIYSQNLKAKKEMNERTLMLMERAKKRELIELRSKIVVGEKENTEELVVFDIEDEIRKARKEARELEKKKVQQMKRTVFLYFFIF